MSLTFGKNRHPITKERLGVPRVLGFVTLLSCSWIAPAIAQVATEGKGQGVEFRTIYVPENRPESWPTGGKKYLPIDRETFDHLVQDAQRATSGKQRVEVVSASHRARGGVNVDKQTELGELEGTSELRIRLHGKQPQLLLLPCSAIAILDAQWEGDSERRAIVASWHIPSKTRADGQPQLGLLVPRSGTLLLKWRLAADPTEDGSSSWKFRLSDAAVQELFLALPTGYQLSSQSLSKIKLEKKTVDESVWYCNLRPSTTHLFRATDEKEQLGLDQGNLRVSQHDDYHLSPIGLDYQATFQIARVDEASTLSLLSTDSFRHLEIQVDGQPASWRRDAKIKQRLMIELPNNSTTHEIVVKASSQLVNGRAWRLPKLIVPFESWTKGSCVVRLDRRFELQSLSPEDARLISVETFDVVESGNSNSRDARVEAYEFQYFSEQASLEVSVAPRSRQFLIEQVSLVEIDENRSNSEVRVALSASQANAFRLNAELLPSWDIESVQTEVAGDLAHWHVDKSTGSPKLRIQLHRAPSNEEPVLLKILGRGTVKSSALPLPLERLNWLSFPDHRLTENILAIQSGRFSGTTLQFKRSPSPTSGPADLDADFTWAEPNPNRLITDLLALEGERFIELRQSAPSYESNAMIKGTISNNKVNYRVDFRVTPQERPLNELIVVSSQELPRRASWILGSESANLVVEELLAGTESPLPEGRGRRSRPVACRIQFANPMESEFTLSLDYHREIVDERQVIDSFHSPSANQWQSWALILDASPNSSRNGGNYQVDPSGSVPVTPPSLDSTDATLLGCYRLPQESPLLVRKLPVIYQAASNEGVVGSSKRSPNRSIVCSEVNVVTEHAPSGALRGTVSYRLEQRLGKDPVGEVAFTFPEEAQLLSAEVDGKVISLESDRFQQASGRAFHFATPPKQNFMVELRYEAESKPLSHDEQLEACLPRVSFPTLHGWWTMRTPPGYEVVESHRSGGLGLDESRPDVFQRLLGPLLLEPETTKTSKSNEVSGVFHTSQVTTVEFGTRPAPVTVQLPEQRSSFWGAAWFASALFSCWLLVNRPRLLLMIAVGLGAACLLLPPMSISVLQALFLGCLSGVIVQAAFQGTLFRHDSPPEIQKKALRVAVIFIATFASLANQGRKVSATEVPPAVLIPYEVRELEPEGEVYVPQSLLQRLQRAAQLSEHNGTDWALLGARYSIVLDRSEADGRISAGESVLAFRIRTHLTSTTVKLPLKKQDANWNLVNSSFNGGALRAVWTKDQENLQLQVQEAGIHELRLVMTPEVELHNELAEVTLSVPRFPGAQLEVIKPEALKNLSLPGATRLDSRREGQFIRATLGASDQLALAWSSQAMPDSAKLRVEQFEWLDIAPERVTGEAKLRLIGEDLPETVTLVHSPIMQIDSVWDQQGASLEVLPKASGEESLLQLPAGSTLPLDLKISFELDRPALGRISFPYLHIKGLQRIRRLFAVSVAEQLSFREGRRQKLRPISPEEFSALWSENAPKPDLAYAMQSKYPDWSVSVRPSGQLVMLDARMALHCAAGHADLEYRSTFIDSLQSLHHVLNVPSELVVDLVEISIDENNNIPLRWTRPSANRLDLFLKQPLSEPCTIRLLGTLTYPKSREFSCPKIEIRDAEQPAPIVKLSRGSEIHAELLDSGGEVIQSTTVSKRRMTSNSRVNLGEYSLNPAELAEAKLRISTNDSQFVARTATVSRDESLAEYAVDLRVISGRVDRLTILADQHWTPRSEEGGFFEVVPIGQNAQGLRQFEILLNDVLKAGDHQMLIVRGDLANANAYRIRAPKIDLAEAQIEQRFLVIPTIVNEKSISWQLSGLRRKPLGPRLSEATKGLTDWQSFIVTNENYLAEQRIFPNELRRARIRYAETDGVLDATGDWIGTTRFLLQPGRATNCMVKAPRDAELISIQVAGQSLAMPNTSVESKFVTFGPPYLPVEIVVTYRQMVVLDAPAPRLQPPQITMANRNLPLRKMHWQIRQAGRTYEIAPNAQQLKSTEFHEQRIAARIAAVSQATPLALQLHPWESRNWLRPWKESISKLLEDSVLGLREETSENVQNWTNSESVRDTVERLKTWEELQTLFSAEDDVERNVTASGVVETESPTTGLVSKASATRSVHLVSEGASGLLLIQRSDWPGTPRWIALGFLLVVFYYGRKHVDQLWFSIQSVEPQKWQRGSQIIVLLLGLCWWYFLEPHFVGALMACLAAATLLRNSVALLKRSRQRQQHAMESTAHQPASP
ncbi:MAG: hypothetical protein RIB44_19490 [Lacipirellulaceae bacterium]